jgi:glutaminyl-peptide cyclotransferase
MGYVEAAGGAQAFRVAPTSPTRRSLNYVHESVSLTMRRVFGVPVALAVLLFGAGGLASCRPADLTFSGSRALDHVAAQCEIGPRSVGSEGALRTRRYILSELAKLDWATSTQEFAFRGVSGSNVIASKGSGPLVLLGAHYDTRSKADRDLLSPTAPVPGANDGASGVAVLLELARTLDVAKARTEVRLVFFDAEDQGNLDGWPFSVGATHAAQQLDIDPLAVVVVDMIGDSDQQIFLERNSDAELMGTLWQTAAGLGYGEYFVPEYGYAIMDDHIPFRQKGWVAVDIIDFDYPFWHTTQDTLDKVSAESLERVGRVLEVWLEGGR